ncbi:MAG TPA: TetR family transcriptional regulator [Ktedonobacterales bacterium]|nr:TetR family transcriptional regulator [Ktedonobacterales bacterium]
MVRKTKEEAAATRQALLDAALIVFSQKGYTAATLEEIAEHAGVSRGAIYWHFRSKADLYNALVEETSTRAESIIQQAVAQRGSILETHRRIMTGLLVMMEEEPTYRAVQELVLFKTEVTPDLEEGIKAKAAALRTVEARVAASLREGIAAGEVRADLDPLIGARASLTYINGIIFTWLVDPQAFSLRESAPALVDVYIRGIAAQ